MRIVAFTSDGAVVAKMEGSAKCSPVLDLKRLPQKAALEPRSLSSECVTEFRSRRTPLRAFTCPAEVRFPVVVALNWATMMREHYGPACRFIRRHMPAGLRPAFDAEDFVGDAILELLSKSPRFTKINLNLLILVAKRRMIDAARSPRNRVVRLEVDTIDAQPSVALESEATELREWLLSRADRSGDRAVVDLRCQGHTSAEIALLTGLRVRTVQRVVERFTEANEPY